MRHWVHIYSEKCDIWSYVIYICFDSPLTNTTRKSTMWPGKNRRPRLSLVCRICSGQVLPTHCWQQFLLLLVGPIIQHLDDPRVGTHLKNIYNIHSLKLTASLPPENRPGPKKKLVFQPSMFRCKLAVSFRGGYSCNWVFCILNLLHVCCLELSQNTFLARGKKLSLALGLFVGPARSTYENLPDPIYIRTVYIYMSSHTKNVDINTRMLYLIHNTVGSNIYIYAMCTHGISFACRQSKEPCANRKTRSIV